MHSASPSLGLVLFGVLFSSTFLVASPVAAADENDKVVVPRVTGKAGSVANREIRAVGLVPKFHLGEAASTKKKSLTVYKQNPAAGALVAKGSQVEITIYSTATKSTGQPKAKVDQQSLQSRPSVVGHSFSDGVATAVDLQHGRGAHRLEVRRSSIDQLGTNASFGSGWSDNNHIIQTTLGSEDLLLWRGGELIVTAHRDGDTYRAGDKTTAQKTPEGWQWKTGRGEILQFNSDGRLVSVESEFGQKTHYSWDASGRLTEVKQNEENFIRYSYIDNSSRVSRIEGPEGLSCRYEYDPQERLSAVTNARNIRVRYEYDDTGQLLRVSDPFGGVVAIPGWDERKEEEQEAARRNSKESTDAFQNQHDELALARRASQSMSQQSPKPVYKYNEHRQVVEKRHRGTTTRYSYNAEGQLVSIKNPAGERQFVYDKYGRVVSVERVGGQTVHYQYTPFGYVSRAEATDGRSVALNFDEHARPLEWKWANGRTVEVAYGADGQYRFARWSPDLITTLKHNAAGQLLRATMSTGRDVLIDYDAKGRITQVAASSGEKQSLRYGDKGQPVEWTIGDLVRQFEYKDRRLTKIVDPLFGERTIDYERFNVGELSLTWNGLGTWTRQTNSWLQPVLFRRPSGQTWRYGYNSRSQLVEVTTPSNRMWHYTRDNAGRVTVIASPGSDLTELRRSPQGQITRVVRSGITHREYIYGPNGRLRMSNSPLGVAAVYSYDNVGRVREVVKPDGKAKYSFNEFGLIDHLEGPDYDVHQEYYDDGTLARRIYQPSGLDIKLPRDDQGRAGGVELNGVSIGYRYDNHGHLSQIVLPNQVNISITRDLAGRVEQISFGQAAKLKIPNDKLSRVVSLAATNQNGNELFVEDYRYDSAGNIIQISTGEAQISRQTYDADDRLIRTTQGNKVVEYDYSLDDDLRGTTTNKQHSRWQLDNSGRPRMLDLDVIYDWDDAGNLTAVQSVDTDVQNKFDAAGQLIRRTVAGLEWRFGYLPNGDRLWQQGPSGRIAYAYLSSGLVGLKDETGVTWLVVTLPGTDRPLALCSSDGEILFLIADRLGSVRRVIDATGKIVASSDYGPFGQLVAADGFAPLNLYAGMICDEHGLYYARRRYYDPQLRRFISLDPMLGLPRFPGSHNAYAYAANNPYRYRDPGGAIPGDIDDEPVTADNFWSAGFNDWRRDEDRRSTPEERGARNRAIGSTLISGMQGAGQQMLDDVVNSGNSILNDLANAVGGLSPWSPGDVAAGAGWLSANVAGNNATGASNSGASQTPTYHPANMLDAEVLDLMFPGISPFNILPDGRSSWNTFTSGDLGPWGDGGPGDYTSDTGKQPAATSGSTPASLPGLPQGTNNGSSSTAGSNQGPGATSSSNNALPDIFSRLLDNADTTTRTPSWGRKIRSILKKRRNDRVPNARPLNMNQILAKIDRNIDNNNWPFTGIFPQPTNEQNDTFNKALTAARKLANDGTALEQDLNDVTRKLQAKGREVSDLLDDVLGPGDQIDDNKLGSDDTFDNLVAAVRRLNQLINLVNPPRTSVADEALARAKEAKKTICGAVERGYNSADVTSLQREGDALLKRARSALDVANDLNKQKQSSDQQTDRLRQQLDKVTDLVDKLSPLPEIKKRYDQVAKQSKALRQEIQDLYKTYVKMTSSGYAGMTNTDSIPDKLNGNADEINILLKDYWYEPQAGPLLQLAARWSSMFQRKRKGMGGWNSELTHDELLGGGSAAVQFLYGISRLVVPDNAEEILRQARDAQKRAKVILDQDTTKADQQLKKDLATAYQAWTLIREAQNCRNRIFGGPATAPLTGNVEGFSLLKALNPRALRLRPRHAESLIPGHPFSALGHPAELGKPKNGIRVPNVVGLSGAVAVKKIKAAGLRPKFQLGKPAAKGQKPFHVYEQTPKSATLIAKGGTVSVNVFGNQPSTVASNRPKPDKNIPKEPTTPPTKKPDKPKKKTDTKLDGTYAWTDKKWSVYSTQFIWKQVGANKAEVVFIVSNSKEAKVLKSVGKMPAVIRTTVTLIEGTNTYVVDGDPFGAEILKAMDNIATETGGTNDLKLSIGISFIPKGKGMEVTVDAKSNSPATGISKGTAVRK